MPSSVEIIPIFHDSDSQTIKFIEEITFSNDPVDWRDNVDI